MQIGACGAVPPAIADSPLRPAKAMLLSAVIIVRERTHAGFYIGFVKRIDCFRATNGDGSRAAAISGFAVFPSLRTLEIWKNLGVGPTSQSLCRPAIVVAAMAAYVAHGVDGVAAADNFAARGLDPSVPDTGLRLGLVAPVEPIKSPNTSDAKRNADQRMPVPPAGSQD